MERILLISSTQKSQNTLVQFLSTCGVQAQTVPAHSGAEGRRALLDGQFDIVLVNTPLSDEFGHELAQSAAQSSAAGVILLVKAEQADAVSDMMEADGVFVLPKPLSRPLFCQALHMVRALHVRLDGLQKENQRLQDRIQDIRLVDRAKCILIELRGMTEPEAHTYIEQQSMQTRRSKRWVAEEILGLHTP
ncbi:MAG: ANTAR domain-containing protein [Eubacteriales bacterium]|nr:ANTAR domain-containing protein [Eubacteriales bacterium]